MSCDSPTSVLLDIELLIDEIKKRSVLWDRLSVTYNDRVFKAKMWDEVHQAVFDDWDDLGSAERRIRAEEIKKKWRNLRDTYSKEIVHQRQARKGKMKQKRPYRYAEALSFLKGQFLEKQTKRSSSESSEDRHDVSKKINWDYEPKRKRAKIPIIDPNDHSNILINVSTLIQEVERRPALWNRHRQQSSDYGERIQSRSKQWFEVCQVLFKDWDSIGSSAKSLRFEEVRKKWRNLRDTYGKEVNMQKNYTLGIIKAKKPYRFSEELSFLHGQFIDKEDFDENSFASAPDVDAESSYSLESDFDDKIANVEEVELPKDTKCNKGENTTKIYDEDVSFTEMLVPLLKKLNDAQKHYAQVEILNILNMARQFDPLGNINGPKIMNIRNSSGQPDTIVVKYEK